MGRQNKFSLTVKSDSSVNWTNHSYQDANFNGLFTLGWLSEFSWSVNEILPSEFLENPYDVGLVEKDNTLNILLKSTPTELTIDYYQCLADFIHRNTTTKPNNLIGPYIKVRQNGNEFYLNSQTEKAIELSSDTQKLEFNPAVKNYAIIIPSMTIREVITNIVNKAE